MSPACCLSESAINAGDPFMFHVFMDAAHGFVPDTKGALASDLLEQQELFGNQDKGMTGG